MRKDILCKWSKNRQLDEWDPSLSLSRPPAPRKHTHTHTHTRVLLSHKKVRNAAICRNMDRSRDYYTWWNKSDRKRQIIYDIIYMWNLKNLIQMNVYTKQKETQRQKNLWLKMGRGSQGGKIRSMGLTHYYTWNKLYSTGNYTQYILIIYRGT